MYCFYCLQLLRIACSIIFDLAAVPVPVPMGSGILHMLHLMPRSLYHVSKKLSQFSDIHVGFKARTLNSVSSLHAVYARDVQTFLVCLCALTECHHYSSSPARPENLGTSAVYKLKCKILYRWLTFTKD